jgi:hypothetical protein
LFGASDIEHVVVNGSAAGDTFFVRGTSPGTDVTISGNGESDIFDVNSEAGRLADGSINYDGELSGILGALSVIGNGGSGNRLVISDDRNTRTGDVVQVTASAISFNGGATSSIKYGTVSGGSFTDGGMNDGILIKGPAVGSTFNVEGTLGSSTTEIVGGARTNTINVGSKEPAINGNLVPIQGALTVESVGTDTLKVDDTSTQGPKSGTLTPTSLLGLGMGVNGITFSGLTTLNLNMGPAALASDTFNITKVNVRSLVAGPRYLFAGQNPAGKVTVAGNIGSVHVDTGVPCSFAGPVATVTLFEGYSPWLFHEVFAHTAPGNALGGAAPPSPQAPATSDQQDSAASGPAPSSTMPAGASPQTGQPTTAPVPGTGVDGLTSSKGQGSPGTTTPYTGGSIITPAGTTAAAPATRPPTPSAPSSRADKGNVAGLGLGSRTRHGRWWEFGWLF